jgi:hypothetical protein
VRATSLDVCHACVAPLEMLSVDDLFTMFSSTCLHMGMPCYAFLARLFLCPNVLMFLLNLAVDMFCNLVNLAMIFLCIL